MRTARALLAAAALGCAAAPALGQSLADRAADMDDGAILFSFVSRPDVCGTDDGDTRTIHLGTDSYWESPCETGPVRVAARVVRGRIVEIDARVGGRWRDGLRGAVDLGTLAPEAGAALLLDFARSGRGEAAEDAVFPATLARGVDVGARLFALARDGRASGDAREAATFWLGQMAGAAAVEGLADLAGDDDLDMELREHAVFALSEIDDPEASFAALEKIARTSPHPRLRQRALFWLAESEDPRALDLFEEILTRR